MSTNRLVDTANHTLESLAWSTFCEVVGTVLNHIEHTGCPTHAACELCNEVVLDFGRLGVCHAVNILVYGALGNQYCCGLDGFLKFLLCRLHKRRVESAAYLKRQRTLSTYCLEFLAGNVDGVDVAADSELAP